MFYGQDLPKPIQMMAIDVVCEGILSSEGPVAIFVCARYGMSSVLGLNMDDHRLMCGKILVANFAGCHLLLLPLFNRFELFQQFFRPSFLFLRNLRRASSIRFASCFLCGSKKINETI